MSISQYFRAAQQLVKEIETGVQVLEDSKHQSQIRSSSSNSRIRTSTAAAGAGGVVDDSDFQLETLETKLKDLKASINYLQGLVDGEGRERRDLWRNRVQALLQECQTFNSHL